MANLVLLLICLLLGIAFRKFRLLPQHGHLALNAFVINISLSALSLYYIPKIEASRTLIFPVGVAWLNILIALAVFGCLGKILGWSRAVTGAVIMCAGFGNTSFVGIPVVQALYGENGIKTVMLIDQPGSFVALSTLGIAVAGYYAGVKQAPAAVLKKILRFPPFLAFLAGLFLNILNLKFHTALDEAFLKLGNTTVPLALVSVGSQLRFEKPGYYLQPLAVGLIFKLLVFPLMIFILYVLLLKQGGEPIAISVMEAAMAPMITAAIIASSHDLEPKLCNLFIGIGIPLSFLTLLLWHLMLQYSLN